MKKITTAAAALALLAGLTSCSLFPSPTRPPDIAPATPVSALPPECPFVGQNDLTPVRIPLGTPRKTIGSVLNAYSGWFNAGSELVAVWSPGTAVPESCVERLAVRNAEAYSRTLFTAHSDVAWQEYFASVKAMNQQNLAAVRLAGPGMSGRGKFELLKEIEFQRHGQRDVPQVRRRLPARRRRGGQLGGSGQANPLVRGTGPGGGIPGDQLHRDETRGRLATVLD